MKDLLQRAREEIIGLRRTNEILHAKVEVMELFACVLHTSPARHNQSMTIDVAWELEQQITELEAAERMEAEEATQAGVGDAEPAGELVGRPFP